jgi:triosephosphate isomerase
MGFKTLSDIDVKGHRVFLRADLNVPINNGVITDTTRISKTMPTLEYLLSRGASVVLCSHLGRPKGIGYEAELSMAPVAEWLKAHGLDLILASGITGEAVENEAASLQAGQVLLLENLRFDKREAENDPEFVKALACLADTYVNDAFSAAHRAHASVSGIALEFSPNRAVVGLLMEKELAAMSKIMHNHERPLLVIMGGSKVSEKIGIIRHFLGKADTILIGGAMSFTFLKEMGVDIGDSLYEKDKLDLASALQQEARIAGTNLVLPLDHLVAKNIDAKAECNITQSQAVPKGSMGLDIGPETVAAYVEEIRKARTILWNGPMGVFELDPFATGTIAIAEEIADTADRGNFVLVGGGDSITAAAKAGVTDRMSYVSTGGGASLEFLSGMDLPGITTIQGANVAIKPIKMIVANWKMNHLHKDAIKFCLSLKASYKPVKGVTVAIAPPLTLLSDLNKELNGILSLYGQNAHYEPNGAFTGEVSMAQIRDSGATGVILGHSERRQYFFETDEHLMRKIRAAWTNGLAPMLCIGETVDQLNDGSALDAIKRQLRILSGLGSGPLSIAYEPRWAIGTGQRANTNQIEDMHGFIRIQLLDLLGTVGHEIPILYGGGVTTDNFKTIINIPEVSGCLVGGASLDESKFLDLISQIQATVTINNC